MKNLKLTKLIASSLIVASMLALTPIGASAGGIQQTVLATVGDEKITKDDLDKELSKYDVQLKQQYGDDYATNDKVKDQITKIKQQQLDSMVTEKILLQKATELNLKPSDDYINKQIDDQINLYKTQYSEEGQWESVLQQNGITEDELKELIKNQIIITAVQDYMLNGITVTEDEVQTYYDENKDTKYLVGAGGTVAHILIAEKASDGSIDYDASLQKANSLKAQIYAGADFATIAKANSIDTGTKDKGGNLGFVAYNSTQLVAEFVAGFKNLKEGEVSQPVKTQYGYHIIKATGLKDAQVSPLDQVKDEVKLTVLQKKQGDTFNSKIAEWKTDLKVKTNEDQL